ncbi:MAG TPA: hypothetical protein VI685_15155 [Candidatus Angelobacter sp.]
MESTESWSGTDLNLTTDFEVSRCDLDERIDNCCALAENRSMTEPEIRLLLRVTAQTSFLLFTGAFAAAGLQALVPGKASNWLARNSDRFLLGFVASHTVHLGLIILLLNTVRVIPPREIYALVIGGFAYLLIYALAAAAIARSMGRKPLALIGSAGFTSFVMYTLWVIFASAFVPRMVKGWPIYSVLGAIALAGVALRIAGGAAKVRAAAA